MDKRGAAHLPFITARDSREGVSLSRAMKFLSGDSDTGMGGSTSTAANRELQQIGNLGKPHNPYNQIFC